MNTSGNNLKTVYFISGLGADKRAFTFLDLSFCRPVFIDWIKPLKKEKLPEYALRLKEQITDPEPVIVGVSFGGMLASEMALADPAVRAFIISSNKVKKEFPRLLLTGKYVPVYKWIPAGWLKKGTFLRRAFFGPKGEKQKKIFSEILRDSDFNFTKWAIEAILHWKNDRRPHNVTHIHGTKDKLLPYKLVEDDHAIEGGSHLMIMNNAEEISVLLRKLIAGLSASSTSHPR